jgi:predicted metalloendopeptidase
MRRQLFALAFVALPLALALSAAQRLTAQSGRAAAAPSGIEIDALDRKIDPCTDFYQFACGGWIAKNPVPADRRSYGRFCGAPGAQLYAAAPHSRGARGGRRSQKGGRLLCRLHGRGGHRNRGAEANRARSRDIDEILNPDDLPVLIAHFARLRCPVLLRFGAQTDLDDATNAIASIDQAGLALPDRDYYLKTDQRSTELRDKYVAVIQKTLTLAGEPAEQASTDAKAVLSIETALATAMLDRVKRRDPASTQHHMTINELQALSPNFNWRKYAAASEAPPLPTINVAVPDYLRALNQLISASAMGDLKAYLALAGAA